MVTTMATERGMAMPMGMSMPGMMPMGQMAGMSPATAMPGMMVPRCEMKMHKMADGMKCECVCEDKTAAAMLQNLCTMMANGMCGCCTMMNGMQVCQCNMPMANCKCEMTNMGCTITCTSGDKAAAKMIQACCDCMTAMMMPGCTCYMTMNNMPICCMVC